MATGSGTGSQVTEGTLVTGSAAGVGNNLYVTPNELVSAAGLTAATGSGAAAYYDKLAMMLVQISREVDRLCRRHFYAEIDTRFFRPKTFDFLFIDDNLSITSLGVDTTWNDTVTTAWPATVYKLIPRNKFPRVQVRPNPNNAYAFSLGEQVIIVGLWGYGNGGLADPFEDLGITGTLAAVSTTSLSLGSYADMQAGMTLKIEDEQMFVSLVTNASGVYTATVERGVNGTTAAAHTAKTISKALYPEGLRRTIIDVASRIWKTRTTKGMKSERIDDYSYTIEGSERSTDQAKISLLTPDEEGALISYKRLRY